MRRGTMFARSPATVLSTGHFRSDLLVISHTEWWISESGQFWTAAEPLWIVLSAEAVLGAEPWTGSERPLKKGPKSTESGPEPKKYRIWIIRPSRGRHYSLIVYTIITQSHQGVNEKNAQKVPKSTDHQEVVVWQNEPELDNLNRIYTVKKIFRGRCREA